MTVNKLSLPAKENAVQNKINEIIDNLSGSITVDQTYNSSSSNAQSGTAVEDALDESLIIRDWTGGTWT